MRDPRPHPRRPIAAGPTIARSSTTASPVGTASSATASPANTVTDDRQGGQALPLVAGALALAVVLLLGLVALGNLAHERAAAQTAADAAALAGAADGRDAAAEEATANGGRLESYAGRGDEVEVVVRVGDARATARARRSW